MSWLRKEFVVPVLALLCVTALLFFPAIPQNQHYHNFADRRAIFGIPNFLNVITNLPFAIVGFLGLIETKYLQEDNLQKIFYTLFTNCLLLTIGSGYYHMYPRNDTLVYDRMPIVIILMSFFAWIIYNCVNKGTGYKLFFILNITGLISVVYWGISESWGKGDLRWYGLVQFFPVVAIPVILLLYNSHRAFNRQTVLIFFFFAIAKMAEGFGRNIFYLLKNVISGHSLKHLFMAAAVYQIVVITQKMARKYKTYH